MNTTKRQRMRSDKRLRRKQRLLFRDGNVCKICSGVINLTIADPRNPYYVTLDHIIPVSLGGSDDLDNLQLTHFKCNYERNNGVIKREFKL